MFEWGNKTQAHLIAPIGSGWSDLDQKLKKSKREMVSLRVRRVLRAFRRVDVDVDVPRRWLDQG